MAVLNAIAGRKERSVCAESGDGSKDSSSPFIWSTVEGELVICERLSKEPLGEVRVGELTGLGSLGVKLSIVPPALHPLLFAPICTDILHFRLHLT